MIVPHRDEILMYRCGYCGQVYRTQAAAHFGGMSCLVNHLPGTCCHYGENLVAEGAA